MKLICWLVGAWRTLTMRTGFIPVSGHDFSQLPKPVFIDGLMWEGLCCNRCGYISWAWTPLRPTEPNWESMDYKPMPPKEW